MSIGPSVCPELSVTHNRSEHCLYQPKFGIPHKNQRLSCLEE